MLSQISQTLTSLMKLGLHQTEVSCPVSCGKTQLHWASVRNAVTNEGHLAMNLFYSVLTKKNG